MQLAATSVFSNTSFEGGVLHEDELSHILTDRGTEYCDKPEIHDYQLYLTIMFDVIDQ